MANVPGQVSDWLSDKDPAPVKRVTSVLWQMEKLYLAELERAASGAKDENADCEGRNADFANK